MFNNPFLKKDPLLEAVKSAQAEGNLRRQAEALVNEEFGVYSRKAVVREQLAAYDARLEEAYKCMKEGEKKDEPKLDMKAREKAKSDYSKMREKMVGKGKDLETTRKIVGEAKKLADKDYDKDGKIETPKDEVWGSRFRAAKMAGKMEEEQIDELYGKGKLPEIRRHHAGEYERHKADAAHDDREASKAKASAAKRGRATALMNRVKASDDLKAAKSKSKQFKKEYKSVNEEQIDEISNEKVRRYLSKGTEQWRDEVSNLRKPYSELEKLQKKRKKGLELVGKRDQRKKMEEGMIDPKDPSVQGSGDVTSTPVKHVRPTNPERIRNVKDPRDPSVQGSGDVTSGGRPASIREGTKIVSKGYGKVEVVRGGKKVKTFKDPREAKMFVSKPKEVKKEETQIDEISKELAGRYIKKADYERSDSSFQSGKLYGKELATKRKTARDREAAKEHNRQSLKREKGINTAVNKLTGKAKVAANEETVMKESIIAKIVAKYMKEDSSFNAAQVTGKSVNEAVPVAMPPAVQQPAPAVRGPAAKLQGNRFYRGINASTSGRGTARFVSPQTASVSASAPPKTGTSVVASGNRLPSASSSSVPAPRSSGAVTATQTPKASGSGFTYSRGSSTPGVNPPHPSEKIGGFNVKTAGSGALARGLGAVGRFAPVASAAGLSQAIGDVATGTSAGKAAGAWVAKNVPGATAAADVMRKAGEAIGVRSKSPTPTTTTPGSMNISKQPAPTKGISASAAEKVGISQKPAPSVVAKSTPVKQSFKQAFSAAREKAKEAGNAATGQFEYGGKKFQTNINPAKGAEKYVAPTQQKVTGVKVEPETKKAPVSTASATPAPTTQDVPTPPKRPKDLQEAVQVGNNKYRIV